MRSRIGTIVLAFTLVVGTATSARAGVIIEPQGATVAGKTIGAWSANWWQWAAGFAPPGDPFTDITGVSANKNQSGPVFYLAGSPGGNVSRQYSVLANTYLLVPLLVGELSQLEVGFGQTEAQVKAAAKNQADQIDSLHATLDGTPISSAVLFGHREVSPDFSFVAVANNQVGITGTGNSGIAVADGYFLMIDPPTPGVHTLNFGGGSSAFGLSINETDTVTVTPEPGGIFLALGVIMMPGRGRRLTRSEGFVRMAERNRQRCCAK